MESLASIFATFLATRRPCIRLHIYLKAAASAADLSGLAIWSKSGHIDSFSAGQLAGPGAGLAELAGSTGSANLAGPAWE